VAAVEFALVAPLLFVLAFGFYDLVVATTIWWHLMEAAEAIGQIATSNAATSNQTNSLTETQAYVASTAIYPLVPQLASATAQTFSVVLSSVVFAPTVANCTSSCTYTAAVAWSYSFLGTAAARACGPLKPATDVATPSPATLPVDAFSAAPLLLVDVSFTYQPLFTSYIKTAIQLKRTAYMPMRTGDNTQWVRYTNPNISQPMCPGYS
jgi:Flp pilus assembly protein TadG